MKLLHMRGRALDNFITNPPLSPFNCNLPDDLAARLVSPSRAVVLRSDY